MGDIDLHKTFIHRHDENTWDDIDLVKYSKIYSSLLMIYLGEI